MGTVLRFPRHSRSSGTRTPKTHGLIRQPKASENTKENLAGIRSRAFQLDTDLGSTPATLAAADVPPSSEMTLSTELSMTTQYPQNMESSSVHETLIEGDPAPTHNLVVDSRGVINQRIRDLLQIKGLSQTALCVAIKEPKTKFNNYLIESSTNLIPPDVASKICDKFEVTLDYIYRGKFSLIPPELRDEILRLEQARAMSQKRTVRK